MLGRTGEGASVFVRSQLLQSAARTHGVVVVLPGRDAGAGIAQIREPVLSQAFGADLVVKALNVRVLDGLPGADEGELHLACIRPGVERTGDERGAVIDRDRVGRTAQAGDVVEHAHDARDGQRRIDVEGDTFPRAGVDQAEHARAATGRTLIADEVHGPDLIRLRGHRTRHPGEQDMQPTIARARPLGGLLAQGIARRAITGARASGDASASAPGARARRRDGCSRDTWRGDG